MSYILSFLRLFLPSTFGVAHNWLAFVLIACAILVLRLFSLMG